MPQIKSLFSIVVLLGLMQGPLTHAALEQHYSKTNCERALTSKNFEESLSSDELEQHIREIVAKDLHYKNTVRLRFLQHAPKDPELKYGVRIFRDSRYPHFFLIDALNEKHLVPHELQTASNYGKYLTKFGLGFVFVGDFQNKSVPLFDGIIIDLKTGEPVANISLKSRQTTSHVIDIEELLFELKDRLSLGRGFKKYMNGPGWFAASSQVALDKRTLTSPQYFDWIRHARILADVFHIPLTNKPKNHKFRELRTVVDMRNSGYPYNLFLKPEIQNAIQKLVDERAEHNLGLTLLWDADRVIEFSRSQ